MASPAEPGDEGRTKEAAVAAAREEAGGESLPAFSFPAGWMFPNTMEQLVPVRTGRGLDALNSALQ